MAAELSESDENLKPKPIEDEKSSSVNSKDLHVENIEPDKNSAEAIPKEKIIDLHSKPDPSNDTQQPFTSSTGLNVNINPSSSISNSISVDNSTLKARKDLENMVLKYAKSERENLQNKQKIDELDKKLKKSIKDNDQLANRIKILTNDKNQLTEMVSAKVAQITVLEQKKSYLDNVQSAQLKESEDTISKLKEENEKLQMKVQSFKSREGELLDFSERLSMKHMLLQTELEETLKKGPNYKEQYELALAERVKLMSEIDNLTNQIDSLNLEIKTEKETSESLRKTLEDVDKNNRKQIDEYENEIKVMRRKHAIAIKELTKEIKILKDTRESGQLQNNTHKIMT